MSHRPFFNRRDAGRQLATHLWDYREVPGLLVLGLARGGVPVAYEVAAALRADLDVLVVRKLGVPGQEELAMGAVAAGGVRVLNEPIVRSCGVSEAQIAAVVAVEERELQRREVLYRGERPRTAVGRRPVILIDDGLATGATMRAAVESVRTQQPARLIVAVPVAAPSALIALQPLVDRLICSLAPGNFTSVGVWYADFSQTSDSEVQQLLANAVQYPSNASGPPR
ncbi:phosphoribosyltransferase [Gloeobacter morelensis]|uniref:Phosphoribosyltransferase n=1 Tax=Gloeobacter morelensis MG652769 TaxID=2781736 RepID=A0ABY3PJW0_9CYAN|nr:phosphoribosyltransferase [Gloeobacter morelensis]UFP93911.1 phosphoribosyltransferase [Gloeobacter morelensis MG652769]